MTFVHYKKSSGNNSDDTPLVDSMKNDIIYGQGHRYLSHRSHGNRYPILKINIFLHHHHHHKKFDIANHLGVQVLMIITTTLPLMIHIPNQSVNHRPYEHRPSTM